MKEISQKYGSLLIQNRDVIREVFPWESGHYLYDERKACE